jgi:hypothetical protein
MQRITRPRASSGPSSLAATFSIVMALSLMSTRAIAGQHPIPVDQAAALYSENKALLSLAPNLHQMVASLHGPEKDTAETILHSLYDTYSAVEPLLTIAVMHEHMVTTGDKAELASQLPRYLKLAKGILDANIRFINDNLASLTIPAALSDAQQIRDRMEYLRHQLEQYSY